MCGISRVFAFTWPCYKIKYIGYLKYIYIHTHTVESKSRSPLVKKKNASILHFEIWMKSDISWIDKHSWISECSSILYVSLFI